MGTDEYAPAGAENTLVATGLPDACLTDDFDDEQGVQASPDETPVWRPEQKSCISTASWSQHSGPEHLRVTTNALRAGFLVLKLRRYPAWRVTMNGRVMRDLQDRDDGLISVPVPQGPVSVTVDWTTTPDVVAGRWVSGLALLGLGGGGNLRAATFAFPRRLKPSIELPAFHGWVERGWGKGSLQAEFRKAVPQGLKPTFYFATLTARLKSCPDTSCLSVGVFRQPVKRVRFNAALRYVRREIFIGMQDMAF